jgi:hypothetical protein
MELLTAFLILIGIIIVAVGLYYFFMHTNKDTETDLRVEEGQFLWIDQTKWKEKPLVPVSDGTILGTFIFNDERYDPEQDSVAKLYGGKSINKQQAWVLRGTVSKVLKYWSYGLFKVNNQHLDPVGYSINSEMTKDSRNGDDIVVIVSPNYKFGQYVANDILAKEYSKKLPDDRHVIFRYFPMPNFDASLKYTMLYEAAKNDAGANPKIRAYRYSYTPTEKEDNFPFFPVEEGKEVKAINDRTVDEKKILDGDVSIFDAQVERQIGKYKQKYVNWVDRSWSNDTLYTSSIVINVTGGTKLIASVMDHSSTGKCLYSELMFVDMATGRPYKSHLVSDYDPANVDLSGKIKTFINVVPEGVTHIRIVERIVVDLSTTIKPDRATIIPARVYVL